MEKEKGQRKGVCDWQPNHGIFTIMLHSALLFFSCSHFRCIGEWQVRQNLTLVNPGITVWVKCCDARSELQTEAGILLLLQQISCPCGWVSFNFTGQVLCCFLQPRTSYLEQVTSFVTIKWSFLDLLSQFCHSGIVGEPLNGGMTHTDFDGKSQLISAFASKIWVTFWNTIKRIWTNKISMEILSSRLSFFGILRWSRKGDLLR